MISACYMCWLWTISHCQRQYHAPFTHPCPELGGDMAHHRNAVKNAITEAGRFVYPYNLSCSLRSVGSIGSFTTSPQVWDLRCRSIYLSQVGVGYLTQGNLEDQSNLCRFLLPNLPNKFWFLFILQSDGLGFTL